MPLEGEEDEGEGASRRCSPTRTAESPLAAAERRDLARALERAIARLRPEYREAVVMFYARGRLVPGDLRRLGAAARHGEDQPPPGAQGARGADDPRWGPGAGTAGR